MATNPNSSADLLARLVGNGLTLALDGHRLAIGPKRLLTRPLRRGIATHLVDLRELVRASDPPGDLAPAAAAVLGAAGPGWVTAEGLARKSGRSPAATSDALVLLVGRGLLLTHAVPLGRWGAGCRRPETLYRDARLDVYGTVARTGTGGAP